MNFILLQTSLLQMQSTRWSADKHCVDDRCFPQAFLLNSVWHKLAWIFPCREAPPLAEWPVAMTNFQPLCSVCWVDLLFSVTVSRMGHQQVLQHSCCQCNVQTVDLCVSKLIFFCTEIHCPPEHYSRLGEKNRRSVQWLWENWGCDTLPNTHLNVQDVFFPLWKQQLS